MSNSGTNTNIKIRRVARLLDKEYGKKIWRKSGDPMSVLIGTILSQNTSDHNSHRAFASLRSRFPDWDDVRRAPVSRIERAIRTGGLSRTKAERIKKILGQVNHVDSDLSLSFLRGWDTDKAAEYLSKFKGVGEKTVACVLLFSLGRPVMPVDTHVFRLLRRLGLVPEGSDARKAHQVARKIVPLNLVYSFHFNLIQHGRRVCKAQNPRCEECIIFDYCEYEKRKNHTKRGELAHAKG